jgi:hypothetical protein
MDAVGIVDAILKAQDSGVWRKEGLHFAGGGSVLTVFTPKKRGPPASRMPSSMLVVDAMGMRSWTRRPSSSSP